MTYFNNIYKKRINRYGEDYQTRLTTQRERLFEEYLLKSIYRVEFYYEGSKIVGSLEKYQQDNSKTLQYLLVNKDTTFPIGTILNIPKNDTDQFWMIYFIDEIQCSGYNRYVVLKMTHDFILKKSKDEVYDFKCYWTGPLNGIADTMKLSNHTVVYENLEQYSITLPFTPLIKKDDYIEVTTKGITEYYLVTGYNIQSTPGVMYVTLDPTLKRTQDVVQNTSEPSKSFWENGGFNV